MFSRYKSVNNGTAFEFYPLRGYVLFLIILTFVLFAVTIPILTIGSDNFEFVEMLKMIGIGTLIIALFCFPFFLILYKYCVHFDWNERKIYRKLLFFKKLKMNADDIIIDRTYFKLIDKTNKYSNELSLIVGGLASGQAKSNEQAMELINLISTKWLDNRVKPIETEKQINLTNLVFFKNIGNQQFELTETNKYNQLLFAGFSLAFLYQVYNVVVNQPNSVGFINFIFVIPAFFFLILISIRRIFDIKNKQALTNFLWIIPYEKMNLDAFDNFSLTKHHTNGLYTGTSLEMLFFKNNNSGKHRNFTILSARKNTKNFDGIMDEIRFLLSKAV
ncbi:hypothetical protein J2X31_003586 [Flavobacterium arsenatis]|uniref:Uncharacterized protein n=1 Tax=Flavobacterium arsenatis TaxID=1484332 RepID=A0ABU1TUJ5_9FLAO|nr:hypothetical protein [Flavobacterium arsenatis]MDR6969553.1 hypothetical protein [Flavobacterium arsenatis]